jgi:hypothetical protein
MTFSDAIGLASGLLTPLLILVLGMLALITWRREQMLRREREDRTYAEQREGENRRRAEQEEASRQQEQFQRLILESEVAPAGNFILTLSTGDPLLIVRAVSALQDLYVEHGFERPQIEEVTRGSVKVKFSTRIAAFFRDPRARELMAELKIAGEEISLGKFSSENNERNASAAQRLAEAMADADEAEYVSDTMVMLKTTDENGKVKMVFRVPTPSELVELRTAGSRELAARRAREVQSSGSLRELTASGAPESNAEETGQ